MSWRAKLSKENAERLVSGRPMKMLRGRSGWNLPGTAPPPLHDVHPATDRSEIVEGRTLVDAARPYWWHLHLVHVPNEGGAGSAGRARSKIMKSQGQIKGVADYFLASPVGGMGILWPGLWLELKAARGKPSDDQEKFLLRMQDAGYACCFAYTADGALAAIQTYLAGRWPR